MRLLILSFFAALLGYSLLFDRGEVQPTDDLQSHLPLCEIHSIDKVQPLFFHGLLSIMPNFLLMYEKANFCVLEIVIFNFFGKDLRI